MNGGGLLRLPKHAMNVGPVLKVPQHLGFGLVGQAVVIGAIIGTVIVRHGIWQAKQKRHNGLFLRRRPTPRCPKCSGFGIVRCILCDGEGVVNYEKKLQRTDPCPQCILKRWIPCDMCYGAGNRPQMVNHERRHIGSLFSLSALRTRFQKWSIRRSLNTTNKFQSVGIGYKERYRGPP